MPASLTDKFTRTYNGTRPIVTTVQSSRSALGATLQCVLLTGWPTASAVHFQTYKKDGAGKKVAGSAIDWKGIVSGNNVGSLTLMGGTDVGNAIGDYVEMMPTNAYAEDLAEGLEVEHNRDGTHNVITTKGLTNTGALSQTGATSLAGSWDGWVGANEAWTFASSTTITVPSNATTKYDIGDFVKITQSATVKYFVITGVASTTLTVQGLLGVTVANSAITANAYSKTQMPHGVHFSGLLPYNPYKFSVYLSANTTTNSPIPFDTRSFDTGSNIDITVNKGRFTAPVAGFYLLSAQLYIQAVSGTGLNINLVKNGAVTYSGDSIVTTYAGSANVGLNITKILQLAAGDYIYVQQTYTGGLTIPGGLGNTEFTGCLVSVI